MKYPGSKNRHAKYILPIMLEDATKDTIWIEPFVGGCNLIDKVPLATRRGYDLNLYLIAMFKAVLAGWIPPEHISEEEYKAIKADKTAFDPWLVGFVGVGCSFSGKWFGGYARGAGRNYTRESRDNLLKQAKTLVGVDLAVSSYDKVSIPEGSVVYCDPPYANSIGYTEPFDTSKFWVWAEELSKTTNVYVSEYTAPEGWKSVYAREVVSSLDLNTGNKRSVEQLFIHERRT